MRLACGCGRPGFKTVILLGRIAIQPGICHSKPLIRSLWYSFDLADAHCRF
jgi:hypothetical protein